MRAAIPFADVGALASPLRRTRLVRGALAAAVVGAAAAAVVLSRGSETRSALLPSGTSPVVVLDVSASIATESYGEIARALRDVAGSGRRIGLVLFSDVAYEALPPGTRASELRPLIRFFEQPRRAGSGSGARPPTPWSRALSGGTRIWEGLRLARNILRRDRIANGSVVLISDLADAPNDRALLADTMVSYVRDSIPLRIVALDPEPEDERLFQGFLQGRATLVRVQRAAGGGRLPTDKGRFPTGLVLAAAALVLLLGANEHALGSLTWGRREAR